MNLFGFACRVLSYATLALTVSNTITVEFSTPYATPTDAMALCVSSPSLSTPHPFFSHPHTISISSIGGSPSSPSPPPPSVLLPGPPDVPRTLVGSLHDLLKADVFYSASYSAAKYDDFARDGYGIKGGSAGPIPGSPAHAAHAGSWRERVHARGWDIRTAMGSFATADVEIRSPASLIPPGGATNATNCVALVGGFSALPPGSRVQIEFNVTNPDQGGPGLELDVWMAPLQHVGSGPDGDPGFVLRGPKYGRVCAPPPSDSSPALNASSCAAQNKLVSAPGRGPTRCISCCPLCTLDLAAGTCTCPVDLWPSVIGDEICGVSNVGVPLAQAAGASPSALASSLCDHYSGMYERLRAGTLSDGIASTSLVYEFLYQGAPLVDLTSLITANTTLYAQYLGDARYPSDPTRRTGVGPNCMSCTGGAYEDDETGALLPVHDKRFHSLAALRLIGIMLYQADPSPLHAYACPSLFDPSSATPFGVQEDPWSSWPKEDVDVARLQPGDIF